MTTLSFWFNPDPTATGFTYTLENDLEPYSIYYWDFARGESTLLYRDPTAAQLDLEKYKSSIIYVKIADDVSIPVQMVYRADLDFAKVNPLWLSAYGAYGDCNDSYFSSLRFSMLDRGVIYAVAHIRGGGEYGQTWHEMGRKQNKKNSFTDFVACMDYMLESGITDRDHLIIEGGSAGGLLMGAVTNLAKAKCRLVIADVPFVDIANTMLDESLPLTIQEYEEWGDPRNPEVFRYILSYSPYNNVTRGEYPEMLITTAWKDTRVGYWEALKWAQMLRSNNQGKSQIVLRMLWNEGHTGSTDRYQSIRTYAQTVAYALYCVGITE
jgi:oligopeptidase B